MSLINRWMLAFVVVAGIVGSISQADAIPVFARKYGFKCTMCHSNFPRLNDFGVRYRENGYQLPGRENEEQTVLETTAPVAFRTNVGYNKDEFRHTEGAESINQFQINGLDLLSGGVIGRNIGYILVYPPEIKGSRGVAAQTGTLEMGSVVFSNVGSTLLNIRAGRFEPAYAAFSAKRTLTFAPYEIYDFAFPGNPGNTSAPFSDTQTGIEFTGHAMDGFKYAAGFVNGSNTNSSDDSPSDVYLRVAKVIGSGEGQTAGHRIGLTGYFGRARPMSMLPAASKRSFNRFGIDSSMNFSHWNLAVQCLTGSDNKALWGSASDVKFSGGFAELSYLPSTSVVGFARYDFVDTGSLHQNIRRFSVGGRYYFEDNMALHVEYSARNQNQPGLPDATEKFFTTRLDVAF